MQIWGADQDVVLPGSQGQWHHYALSYDGATVRLYYDGALRGEWALALNTGAADFVIGRWQNDSFDGLIDDVRVYDRALSLTEIQALANGEHPQISVDTTLGNALDVNGDLVLNSGTLRIYDGLRGYWKLDEGSGATAVDSSGYGQDGTLNGSPLWDTTTPDGIEFNNPYALNFDGADDYVSCGSGPTITGANPRTVAAWAYTRNFNSGGIFQGGITQENLRDFSLRTLTTDNLWRLQFWGTDIDITLPNSQGQWHHYALSYDGTTVRLYYDGALQVEQALALNTGAADFMIGRWQNDSFDGLIDDVRVYDRALSAVEVQALADGYDVQAHPINIAGDFVRNGGVFEHGGGTVTFDGSATQTLDTDTIAFYDLTVGNGSTLVDLADFTVDGTLTNNGSLQRTQDVTGDLDVTFFNTGGYGGLTLNANGSDLGSTTVRIRGNQDCTNGASGSSVKRCFDIAPTNTSGLDATMRLYFSASELGSTTCSGMQVWRWNGSSWEAAGTVNDNQCTTEPYYVEVTGVSSFSPFVSDNNDPDGGPTAVTLARFTARHAGSMSDFVLPLALVALGVVGVVILCMLGVTKGEAKRTVS